MNKKLLFSVFKRFTRAFVSGAITTMIAVPMFTDFTLTDVKAWLIALIAAAITGGLMALDKAIRYK